MKTKLLIILLLLSFTINSRAEETPAVFMTMVKSTAFILKISLAGVKENTSAKIINLNGIVVNKFQQVNTEMDVSRLQPGMYLLQITLPSGKVIIRKFIKK